MFPISSKIILGLLLISAVSSSVLHSSESSEEADETVTSTVSSSAATSNENPPSLEASPSPAVVSSGAPTSTTSESTTKAPAQDDALKNSTIFDGEKEQKKETDNVEESNESEPQVPDIPKKPDESPEEVNVVIGQTRCNSTSNPCQKITGSECKEGECLCLATHVPREDGKSCIKIAEKAGDSCELNKQCENISAVCTNGMCKDRKGSAEVKKTSAQLTDGNGNSGSATTNSLLIQLFTLSIFILYR